MDFIGLLHHISYVLNGLLDDKDKLNLLSIQKCMKDIIGFSLSHVFDFSKIYNTYLFATKVKLCVTINSLDKNTAVRDNLTWRLSKTTMLSMII